MYTNVGRKIKGAAVFAFWVGVIVSCIIGFVLIIIGIKISSSYYQQGSGMTQIIAGLAIAIVGSICSWLGSLSLYGFGELIEYSRKMEDDINTISTKLPKVGFDKAFSSFQTNRELSEGSAEHASRNE